MRDVFFAWDTLVRQYVRCDVIIESMYNLAASVVIELRMCLKLERLNLTFWDNFLMCGLNDKVESIRIPRYLNSLTVFNGSPDSRITGSGDLSFQW